MSRIREFHRDRNGAAAVEFGFIAIPLLALVGMILFLSISMLQQGQLVALTERLSRELQVEMNLQSSAADYLQNHVCLSLPPLIGCANLSIAAEVLPADPSALVAGGFRDSWCFGSSGDTVLLTMRYIPPTAISGLSSIIPAGASDGQSLARVLFKREPHVGVGTC